MNRRAQNLLFKIAVILVVTIAICLFIFRKQIADHNVTKAKIEAFKRMSDSKPSEWSGEIKFVIDSMIIQRDTISEITN